jgi:hypothetical protein
MAEAGRGTGGAEGNEGINALARTLQERMQRVNLKPPVLDFGVIQADMSLLTNYFPLPIPQTDYVVCRSVTWGPVGAYWANTQAVGEANSGEHKHGPDNGEHPHGSSGEHDGHTSGDGAHEHPDTEGKHEHPAEGNEMQHVHHTLVGEKFRSIVPGDRVLVAWVGDDACVIDKITPAMGIL